MSADGRLTETLTIMMTDVEGSTALRLERGDLVADEILGAHAALVREQLRKHGGQERQFLGDGFLLSFPSPDVAVGCAVGIQRALAEHNSAEPERQVRVRIGIHVGEVSERRGELYGQALHAAARVMAEAAGGQVLVSADVRDRLEPDNNWRFFDLGLFWLKGFPERWRLYEVSWADATAGQRTSAEAQPLTPLVERDPERARLRRAVDEARAGHGGLVLVAGEAGLGKSRLVAEVAREAEARGMRVLTGHCVESDGAAPYLPYVEIIEEAISSPRSPLALREALSGVAPEVARIAPALRRVLPDIGPPVELPPELAQRYVWNSVAEFLTRGAQRQPLLLVLEDLHWADESTVLMTEYLAPLIPELPVLLLGTYRDGEVDLSHPLSRVLNQLARRRLVDRISLQRLSSNGVRAMVEVLAGQPAPAARPADRDRDGGQPVLHRRGLPAPRRSPVCCSTRTGGYAQTSRSTRSRCRRGSGWSWGSGWSGCLPRRARRSRRQRSSGACSPRISSARWAAPTPEALVDAFDEAEHARLVAPMSRTATWRSATN